MTGSQSSYSSSRCSVSSRTVPGNHDVALAECGGGPQRDDALEVATDVTRLLCELTRGRLFGRLALVDEAAR